MPQQHPVWRRSGEPSDARLDRPQALEAIQRTLALGAAAVGGATWYLEGFMQGGDPLVPATLATALIMWMCPWATRRMPLEIRVGLFHVFTLGSLAMYIFMRHVAGNPVHSAAYVAVPVLAAVILSGMVASFATVLLSAAWTALVTVKGWVVTTSDDLATTAAILAVAAVVTAILARERRRSTGWVRRWRAERLAMDSLLAGTPDAVLVVDRRHQPVMSNQAASEWCASTARCTPNTENFWENFDDALAAQWDDAMAAAMKGQKRVLLFQTGVKKVRRWRATLIPHLRAEGAIITIQNVTDAYPSDDIFELARITQARQYLRPSRDNCSKPSGPLKPDPGALSEATGQVV